MFPLLCFLYLLIIYSESMHLQCFLPQEHSHRCLLDFSYPRRMLLWSSTHALDGASQGCEWSWTLLQMSYPTPNPAEDGVEVWMRSRSRKPLPKAYTGTEVKGSWKTTRALLESTGKKGARKNSWAQTCFDTPQPYLRIPEEMSDSRFLRRNINRQSWGVGGVGIHRDCWTLS